MERLRKAGVFLEGKRCINNASGTCIPSFTMDRTLGSLLCISAAYLRWKRRVIGRRLVRAAAHLHKVERLPTSAHRSLRSKRAAPRRRERSHRAARDRRRLDRPSTPAIVENEWPLDAADAQISFGVGSMGQWAGPINRILHDDWMIYLS